MKKQGFTALIVGILFGLGLTLSGMTLPQKVIGFLDLFGHWDPSLAFVMMGAIGVHFIAYRIKKSLPHPFFAQKFLIPTKKEITLNLVVGSALFGVGWGIGGYCPGPAITSLITMSPTIFVFVFSMALGMWIQSRIHP